MDPAKGIPDPVTEVAGGTRDAENGEVELVHGGLPWDGRCKMRETERLERRGP